MDNNINIRQVYERFRPNNNIVNVIIRSVDIASGRNTLKKIAQFSDMSLYEWELERSSIEPEFERF